MQLFESFLCLAFAQFIRNNQRGMRFANYNIATKLSVKLEGPSLPLTRVSQNLPLLPIITWEKFKITTIQQKKSPAASIYSIHYII